MTSRKRDLPLVYSCSGCSSAAQTANHIALELDRHGVAEMSCIAGVGGNVPHLVRIARAGRPILALDGCPLACARSCLAQRGIAPTRHVLLHEHGVRKRYHQRFDEEEAGRLVKEIAAVARELARTTPKRDHPEQAPAAP